MEKITLYELLNNFNDLIKFKLSEKIKINVITSTSENADVVEEFYFSEVPLRLLRMKVYNVDYDDNWIEILKE
jgi:hypothetical protein